jgi:hypothetical protein
MFSEGLQRPIDGYASASKQIDVSTKLEEILSEREILTEC